MIDIDIVAITESWTNETIGDAFLIIDGFAKSWILEL